MFHSNRTGPVAIPQNRQPNSVADGAFVQYREEVGYAADLLVVQGQNDVAGNQVAEAVDAGRPQTRRLGAGARLYLEHHHTLDAEFVSDRAVDVGIDGDAEARSDVLAAGDELRDDPVDGIHRHRETDPGIGRRNCPD